MVLCFATGLAQSASAQAPKAFDDYEDSSDLGFKVKVPKEWDFIPPSPGDKNLIGKFDPKGDKGIDLDYNTYWKYHVWLVKFDRRKKPADAAKKDEEHFEVPGLKDVEAFIRGPEIAVSSNWKKVDKEGGPLQIAGVVASATVYETTKEKVSLRLYVAQYKLSDDVDIALIANCSGDAKRWAKFEGAFSTMGKSFRRLELKAAAVSNAKAGDSPERARTRSKLEAQIRTQTGWSLYETPNYFIVSNNPDKEFVDELMTRLEAIRKCYEETYPPEKVLALKKLHDEAEAKRKAAEPKKAPEEGDDPPEERRTEAKSVDSIAESRCSVVRVVQNEGQYHSYGGPNGSAGYFSPMDHELVIYDDKAEGGRRNTWATMNHEAFHQYIYFFFGSLSPHRWYDEGTGDFYAGYQLKNSRFELRPFDWRVSTIKEALRTRGGSKQTYIPIKELVRYTQPEYYGKNKYDIDGHQNYAQGWSFIWFLRTGAKNCRGWNKTWTPILDTYLKVLAETDDLDQAVDQAFAGVDWDELEKAWIDYTLAI
ncbi:MAG TPA: hypothetical protein VK843_18205 [Planctomycetota bacterium]|nr:hypothetical protein [Planctomycetota bacterium]